MFGVLRVIRGFIGFLLLISIADVANPILDKFNSPLKEASVTDSMWFDIFNTQSVSQNITIGIIAIIIFLALFIGLRKLINLLYEKQNGEPHPSLIKAWNL